VDSGSETEPKEPIERRQRRDMLRLYVDEDEYNGNGYLDVGE
jgi:hypothetical protein